MRLIITMTLLIGWLVVEIRDFCFNGGLSHFLAFGLLKIILILASIIVIIMVTFWINILPVFKIRANRLHRKQMTTELPAENHDEMNHATVANKLFRKNSF